MTEEDGRDHSYEDFVISNAAFSFLVTSSAIKYLQTYMIALKICLGESSNNDIIDQNFLNIRAMTDLEFETLKTLKLSLFKFMAPHDYMPYGEFMENVDKEIKRVKSEEEINQIQINKTTTHIKGSISSVINKQEDERNNTRRLLHKILIHRANMTENVLDDLYQRLMNLYTTEDKPARNGKLIEIMMIIDEISELLSKNIDDITNYERIAIMPQSPIDNDCEIIDKDEKEDKNKKEVTKKKYTEQNNNCQPYIY